MQQNTGEMSSPPPFQGNLHLTKVEVEEPCRMDDIEGRFFLHITPANIQDLPDDRKQHGFDNLDFDFSSFGIVTDGRCIAVRDLPLYDIQHITTGQFGKEERVWSAEFSPNE